MQILKQGVQPITEFETSTQPMIVLCSVEPLAKVAIEQHHMVIQIDIHNASDNWHERLKMLLQMNPSAIIANAIGFNYQGDDHHDLLAFADLYYDLIDILLKQNTKRRIVSVTQNTSVVMSFFNGMAVSVQHETSKLGFHFLSVSGHTLSHVFRAAFTAAQLGIGSFQFDGDQMSSLRWDNLSVDKSKSNSSKILRQGAAYAIIGGSGGIGKKLSTFLADAYGAKVALIGRKDLDSSLKMSLKEARAVSYIAVDSTNKNALSEAFEHIEGTFGPLDGIFHLAGHIDDDRFINQTKMRLHEVLLPKVGTLLNLAQLVQRHRFRFICTFSSLSSVLGHIGQATYSAANRFVDDFSALKNQARTGCEWFSINWGLWETTGMQMTIHSDGLVAMQPRDALAALEQVLDSGNHRAAIFSGNLELTRPNVTNESFLMTSTIDVTSDEVEGWLRDIVIRFSGLENIGADDSFIDAGIDSAALMSIAASIESRLHKVDPNFKLHKAVLFDYTTIQSLADYLKKKSPIKNNLLSAKKPLPSNAVKSSNNCRDEDIAIIGIAGEFPGANSTEELWTLLINKKCAVDVIPIDRWSWKKDYSTAKGEKGKTYGRHGGFIEGAKEFDPSFFGITPSEAIAIDPQERRFLQTAYHALEDAGFFNDSNRKVGVFAATMFAHYQDLNDPEKVVSSSLASIANRVSYALDFVGPSLSLDTMCSGSLSALHLAVNSLKNSECAVALAGAVNIMPDAGKYRLLAEGNFLSPTGRCQSFGIDADGYVPGEGTVVLVLKRLREAIVAGDTIHGIIRASAINSGGHSSGYTVPSSKAQAAVIQQALAASGIAPADITYIEAHGTGTSLGDPIETQGILSSYAKDGSEPCFFGSIKSNIGHLEAAAGFAGLAKILLQFKHRKIAPTLFSTIENPHLGIAQTRFQLAKDVREWTSKGPRYAGLSSFGAGGSNAHVIIEEYTANPAQQAIHLDSYLIPISAKSKTALQNKLQELTIYLQQNPKIDLYGLGYTLSRCREHFSHRKCFIVKDQTELLAMLEAGSEVYPIQETTSEAFRVYKSYLIGQKCDFSLLYKQRRQIDLPRYPFLRETYWWKKNSVSLRERADSSTPESSATLLYPDWIEHNLTASWTTAPAPILILRGDEIRSGAALAKFNDYESQGQKTLAVAICDDENILVESHFRFAEAIQRSSCRCKILYVITPQTDSKVDASILYGIRGLYRVLAMENERITCRTLELLRANRDYDKIYHDEFKEDFTNYIHIRYAGEKRSLLSLNEYNATPNRNRLRIGGVYLITGGLGMIGQALAQMLINHYQAKIVLLGRSSLNQDKISPSLKTMKDSWVYILADVTKRGDVDAAIKSAQVHFGGLHGIIHSAAVLHDGLLSGKMLNDFEKVIDVKIAGARNLDAATTKLPLDFFVVFSSLSSVIGNVGQSDYVTANSALDAFCQWRNEKVATQARSGHSIAINWPLWLDETVTAHSMEQYRSLANYLYDHYGLKALSMKDGVNLFERIVNCTPLSIGQVVPLQGDLDRIVEKFSSKNQSTPKPLDKNTPQNIRDQVSESDIIGQIAKLTGLNLSQIDPNAGLGDLGLSSVHLLELSTQMTEKFDIAIPTVAFFKYNTVRKLSAYLKSQVANKRITGKEGSSINREVRENAGSSRYAVIGIDGRLPGGKDLDDYWQLLLENRSAIQKVTRWSNDEYFAGLIPDMDHFDAKFFGMSPKEAMLLDPQHRLFLQTAYRAFLDGGYNPRDISKVGVFVGVQFSDYQNKMQKSSALSHPYAATGNAHAMLANRISYLFDFEGPSQTIDTACSSAMVAIIRGLIALERGECDYVLAGAVSLLIDHDISDAAQSMGILSPDFRCATFDASANGYVRGEGVGALVIKRYNDAIRDNDTICAVIESFAENHGGKASSLTAPNPEAQTKLLLKAYTPELAQQVSFIETHGTGTNLGDPVEIEGLKSAWKSLSRDSTSKAILLGAVKTNVGHLEPAAGIASIFKVILAMRHEMLPANVNFKRQNPHIDLTNSPFSLLTTNTPWQGKKVAGISSFGFGGSNTHLVLSAKENQTPATDSSGPQIFTLSARSLISLRKMRNDFCLFVEKSNGQQASLQDIAFTLNVGREHFEYRIAVIAGSHSELIDKLRAIDLEALTPVKPYSDTQALTDKSELFSRTAQQCQVDYLKGVQIPWHDLYRHGKPRRLRLPTYSFDTQRFWFED